VRLLILFKTDHAATPARLVACLEPTDIGPLKRGVGGEGVDILGIGIEYSPKVVTVVVIARIDYGKEVHKGNYSGPFGKEFAMIGEKEP